MLPQKRCNPFLSAGQVKEIMCFSAETFIPRNSSYVAANRHLSGLMADAESVEEAAIQEVVDIF